MIATSDKSNRFVVLKKSQYINSGEKHVSGDQEIQANDIKQFQDLLNAHTSWIVDIFSVCSSWGQEERMHRNTIEKGEQSCPMVCLLKDHKGWVFDEKNQDPPSRPVVAGNVGINRNISEVL